MKGKWIALIVVGFVVVAAIGAFGGYTTGVKAGVAQGIATRNAFLAARGFNTGQGGTASNGQGSNGRQFNPGNFTAGLVKQINGNTIQLTTAQSVVTVQVTDQTQIQKSAPGALSDIQAGERITVQGAPGSNGVITAQSIQIGGRFPGGGQNGQPGQGNGVSASAGNATN